jgi:carboxypeptidase Taq
MSFARLDELCRAHSALEHAQSILGADEATNMAPGGGGDRAEAMARLAAIAHGMMTAPHVAEWLDDARGEALDGEQQAAVRELARVHAAMTALPGSFVEKQTAVRMRCEQAWRTLRAKGDWKSFEPLLAEVLSLAREEAAMRAQASGLDPYDALIDQYDPGTRAAAIAPVFAELKAFLKDFLPQAVEAHRRRAAAQDMAAGVFPTHKQRQLGLDMMAAVGFDFERGSLSVSHHPFCGGVPSDVRITTRYREDDFLPALMGVLHETGHALYEQNLPQQWRHWPSGKARGMAMHESQSLFVEKQIGRNAAFWRFALPKVRETMGVDWNHDAAMARVLKVEPGLIRVDADEASYPLHVILRFELEQELISGRMQAADLPEAWDAKMREYLGLSSIDDPANGPMQDVHWPSGAFGYFPSYTLGAILAAQQWAAAVKAHPDAERDMEAGNVERLNDWRRDAVWRRASLEQADDITRAATGEPMNARHFIDHLKRRYAA